MEIVVILHNIRSLQNVGSIFRTADAADVRKIYLAGITPVPIDIFGKPRQQMTKVSLGAERYVQWDGSMRSPQATLNLLERLKQEGCKIFSIEQSKKAIPYYKISARGGLASGLKKSRIALILGSEIKGLPKSILDKSDKVLEIPMHGKKESLNVAVAFGIVVFHIKNCYNP